MSEDPPLASRLPEQDRRRFRDQDAARRRVWEVLVGSYFSRHLGSARTVLDLGCGWGYFINNVGAPHRHAIDLNPDVAAHLEPGVTLHTVAASDPWPIDDGALDVVFTSNFIEHLPDREALMACLAEAHRCLRPGGRRIAMGPNIRAVGGAYWDFFDHLIPLTDRSVTEALELSGLEVDTCIPRFLPYTMEGRIPAGTLLVRAYLRLRPAWRFFGGQFLVVARRPEG